MDFEGIITKGIWHGTAIESGYGGTGFSTYVTGDLIYASATNVLSKLTAGADDKVLTMVAGVPAWATVPAPSGVLLANGTVSLTGDWNMGAFSAESKQTAATAATVYDGLKLTNSTAATSGNQQYSPAIHWSGQGWKTTATAASQSVDFRTLVVPVQGTTNPTGYLSFGSNVNGAGWTDGLLTILNNGNVGIGTAAPLSKMDVNGGLSMGSYAGVTAAPSNSLIVGGNLGVGNPISQLWNSIDNDSVIQLGGVASFMAEKIVAAGSSYNLSNNAYYGSAGWKYITGDYAANYYQVFGGHNWRVAASGTAGNSITWTTAMTISNLAKVGIGQTSPTAFLHLKAGTATANTAPLKFTSGTNLTTAEAGAMEYNNTFHLTNSDATRRHIALAPNTTKVTAGAPYTNDGYVVINIGGTDFKLMTTA